jgi:hypothetical protein
MAQTRYIGIGILTISRITTASQQQQLEPAPPKKKPHLLPPTTAEAAMTNRHKARTTFHSLPLTNRQKKESQLLARCRKEHCP